MKNKEKKVRKLRELRENGISLVALSHMLIGYSHGLLSQDSALVRELRFIFLTLMKVLPNEAFSVFHFQTILAQNLY